MQSLCIDWLSTDTCVWLACLTAFIISNNNNILVLPMDMFLTSSWTVTRPSGHATTSDIVSIPSRCLVSVVVTSDRS